MFILRSFYRTVWSYNFVLFIGVSFPFSSLLLAQAVDYSEQYLEHLEENDFFEPPSFLENLHQYKQHPLNINKDALNPLLPLGLLTDYQLHQLQQYLYKIGPLLSIYELQAVPSFDKATILRLRPFITVDSSLDAVHLSLVEQIRTASHTLYFRAQGFLESKKGFLPVDNPSASTYQGSAQKIYLRHLLSYGNTMSLGFTAEKDAGETFLKKSNIRGFDFYSFHFFLKNLNQKIKRVVIGDFTAQFGQGLILNTGFSRGKGANITAIKTSGATINRFTATSEYSAFRGIAGHLQLLPNLQLTHLVSYRKRDAKIRNAQNEQEELPYFSAFQNSGFHRTINEIEQKKTVQQFTTALQLQHTFKDGDIRLSSLLNHFDIPLLPSSQPYNQYRYQGSKLWNTSLSYQYTFLNYHFFGETALSQNGAVATTNGVVSNLFPTLDIAIHWRQLPPHFHSLFGQAFTESSGNNNEQGIYVGWSYRPNPQWQWSGYADFWKHPWLKFLVDAPSSGREYFTRVTFKKRKKMEAYLQWKQEFKQRSYKVEQESAKALLTRVKSNIRIHCSYHYSQDVELRSRIEGSFFKLLPAANPLIIFYDSDWIPLSDTKRKGLLVYQDLLYKPKKKPFQFTGRIACFFIANYDARIYAYENDLLNQFSIPAYFNKGHRIYGNIRYQAKKWLTLEARLSQTYYWNQQTIGSGLEEIDGPRRTEVKLQVRCKW